MFQGRFDSCPPGESHLDATARYVLFSPSGRVWSSAAFHAGTIEQNPLIERNNLLELLPNTRAWLHLMNSEDAKQRNALRQATRTGWPGDDAAFIARAEQMYGRNLALKKVGRKAQRAW